jgi:hypothetical protein
MNELIPASSVLTACPNCGCKDLFIRKAFPQMLGLSIVVIAAIAFLSLASSRQHFYLGAWILVGAAIVDAALYALVPKMTVCYRCRAEFRDPPINPNHHGYELAVGEKYRQHDARN